MQMAYTLNNAFDWHQLGINKFADWTKLHVLRLLFFDCFKMTKMTYLHKRYFTR